MVNRRLRRPSARLLDLACDDFCWQFPRNFATIAALTPSSHGAPKSQEVVLVQAIHELLRLRGGRGPAVKGCVSSKLRLRSPYGAPRLRTRGLTTVPFAGDRACRQ